MGLEDGGKCRGGEGQVELSDETGADGGRALELLELFLALVGGDEGGEGAQCEGVTLGDFHHREMRGSEVGDDGGRVHADNVRQRLGCVKRIVWFLNGCGRKWRWERGLGGVERARHS